MTPDDRQPVTLADVARTHGIHPQTLHQARRSGRLLCYRIGEGRRAIYLVDRDSLATWLVEYRPRVSKLMPTNA